MLCFFWRLGLILIGAANSLCAVAVVFTLLLPQPVDASELSVFLAAPDCATGGQSPCWQGIRVGETDEAQAYAVLSRLEWVTDLNWQPNADYISWHWRADGLSFLDDVRLNGISLDPATRRVAVINLFVDIPLATLWNVMGKPDTMTGQNAFLPDPRILYQTYHSSVRVYGLGTARCPFSPYAFWDSRIGQLTYFGEPEPRQPRPVDWGGIYRNPRNCLPTMPMQP